MTEQILPQLKPIPIKERLSVLFIQYGRLDVIDGAFVLVDKNGVRTHIPVGSVACLMLEPGTRVSHAAVTLASRVGCLLVWVGEAGVRLYASGQPGGARADRLLYQAKLALDDTARLKVVRKMYELRFKEKTPAKRSVEQLRVLKEYGSENSTSSWPNNIESNGLDAVMTTQTGEVVISPTAACHQPPPVFMVFVKQQFWPQAMLRP